jgi:hypothetical protein
MIRRASGAGLGAGDPGPSFCPLGSPASSPAF